MRQFIFTHRYALLFTLAALPMLLATVHFSEPRQPQQGTSPSANADLSAHGVHAPMPHTLSLPL